MNKVRFETIEETKRQLKNNGLKVTQARLKLLDIFKRAKKPLSIKQIAEQLGDTEADIVTLYRNVESLENLGLIKQIRLTDRQSYYELITENHHHHLICKICGKIADVKECDVTMQGPKLLKTHGFAKVTEHSLEFFGVCSSCDKK
jgi:Fur family ferric uptake transcriptional regulator